MWPDSMTVGPLREWPGTLTSHDARRVSPFRAGLSSTLLLLDHELDAIHATAVALLVAIAPDQFRLDGRPRAAGRASHPGVVLSFDLARVGHLAYPCDTYTTWEDNLRAIALALEALRKVDRYGVTSRGEQYRGFLALEATGHSTDLDADLGWLATYTGLALDDPPLAIVRRALRRAHPDAGGTAADFQHVAEIEQRLREAGRL